MENQEILVELELNLANKFDCELDQIYFLKGTKDIVVFIFDHDEQMGLYSLNTNTIIYGPEVCSDEEYHKEFNLISLIRYRGQKKIWLDKNGNIIVRGGDIIKEYSNGYYLINKEHEIFSKDRIYDVREIYRPNFDLNQDDEYNATIAYHVIDATEDENGRFLMIETTNTHNERFLGIYDMKEMTWVCKKQKVNE